MRGWDIADIGYAVLAIGVLGAASLSLAFLALRGRVS
jgi:hypothetical protein